MCWAQTFQLSAFAFSLYLYLNLQLQLYLQTFQPILYLACSLQLYLLELFNSFQLYFVFVQLWLQLWPGCEHSLQPLGFRQYSAISHLNILAYTRKHHAAKPIF